MVGCNRLIKIIVMTLGIYLLVVNVVLWANDPHINMMLVQTTDFHWNPIDNFQVYHNTKMTDYRGFAWFFERLSTYPGLQNTVSQITNYGRYVSTLHLGPAIFISILTAVVKGLVVPFQLLGAFVVDIYNNLVWFAGFIVNL